VRARSRQPAKSRLSPCLYQPDPTLSDPRDPDHPLCRCGLHQGHIRHQLPDASEATAEHRRRIGDAE